MWRWAARRLVPDEALRLHRGPWTFLYAQLHGTVAHGGLMPEIDLYVDGRRVRDGTWVEAGDTVHVTVHYPNPDGDLRVELHAL